jgi:lipoprotein NlpD
MGWTIHHKIYHLFLAASLLTACASPNHRPAPVEERQAFGRSAGGASAASGAVGAHAQMATTAAVSPSESGKPLPGIENAGKPGYLTVKPGDTLIRIGLETGQNWKDLVKWNNLEDANVLEAGQVVRVIAPGADPNAVATRAVTAQAKVEARPLDAPKLPTASATPTAAAAASAPTVSPAASSPSAAAPSAPAASASVPISAAAATPPPSPAPPGEDELSWQWPAAGSIVGNFEEARSKGLSIGGKAGEPVFAAADGRVVYAGSGLRGYGNLVILKHNNTYLSAYAHNQKLLVKEEQAVRRGQKIAEMGSTDADKVKLHFEIRKLGKPIDPAKLLPPR